MGGSCYTADVDLTGRKYAPLWRTLSHSGLRPNVVQKCPLLEDFLSQSGLFTKCGPKCAPHWKTLSRSGLWPNVAQNVPLIGGLCHTADFNQMWSKNVPLIGGLCHAADFDQMWSKMCPSLEDFVMIWTLFSYGPIYAAAQKKWQSCSRGRHKPMVSGVNNINRSNEDQKPPDSVHVIEPKMIKNDAYCTNHAMKDKWHASQATIDPQWCSIVYPWIGNGFIAFTWTIWRFVHAYAGLLVNGLMITEFACREA